MEKHTPGPWHITADYNYQHITDETATRTLATLDRVDEQDDANAALIAAAPELLAALVAVVEAFDTPHYLYDACLKARAAIAKAQP